MLTIFSPSASFSIKQTCWKGCYDTANFFYETPTTVAWFIISGIALRTLFPFMGPPFFGISLAILATRLVLKGVKAYNLDLLLYVKDKAEIFEKFPILQIIGFIFSLAISGLISYWLGFIVAGAVGVISGIFIQTHIVEQQLTLTQSQNEIPEHKKKLM